jgi:RHS repeat-associated protein
MPGRNYINGSSYRYGFNGKENDNETVGTGSGTQDYGMRIYNPALGRFLSIDPLTAEYPFNSTYAFAENSPIAGTDLDGAEFFYAANGAFIGQIGKSTEVRVIDESKVKLKTAVALVKLANAFKVSSEDAAAHVDKFSSSLGVNHDVFLAFGSVVNNESSGGKEESFAIANVTMNFIEQGGSSDLKTLEDVTMYDNSFAQGAKESEYQKFNKMSPEERNAKHAIAAVINALGASKNIAGFEDNTNGADGWDGIDLISTKYNNAHRNYTWSEGSKTMTEKFRKDNNGGVKVKDWTYKKTGFQIEATKIIGKTIFTDLKTGRGESKENKTKFTKE